MATHKHVDAICIGAVMLCLLVTAWFLSGIGLTRQIDADAERYEDVSYFTENDLNGAWDTANATTIVLRGTQADIEGTGAYLYGNDVVLSMAGSYVLRGEWEGSIVVQTNDNAKVWILLDGVSVSCQDDACLQINAADKVFLTLAEGSENSFHSGAEYSEEALADGTDGTIFAHDDLTVNGTGSLCVTAEYRHGIAANDDLVLVDAALTVEAAADGLHANDSLRVRNAVLNVSAEDDALHCDTEIRMDGGTIQIPSCYEGLEAPQITILDGTLEIHASDDGINACGEAGAALLGESEEKATLPTVTIEGGTVQIFNAEGRDADGIDSNGDIILSGGTVFISLNDSGANTALDYGSENGGVCRINGGTVIACGSRSMLEELAEDSLQASILYLPETGVAAGSTLCVQSAAGEELLSATIPNAWSAAILSTPALTLGESYTVTAGEQSATLTLTGTVTSYGQVQSAFAPQQGDFGDAAPDPAGEPPDGAAPDFEGEPPQARREPPTASEGGTAPDFEGEPPAASGDGAAPNLGGEPPAASGDGTAPDLPVRDDSSSEESAPQTAQETLETEELWLLGGSVAVLLLALGVALAYRKRG